MTIPHEIFYIPDDGYLRYKKSIQDKEQGIIKTVINFKGIQSTDSFENLPY